MPNSISGERSDWEQSISIARYRSLTHLRKTIPRLPSCSQDTKTREGPYKHPALSRAIAAAYFSGNKAMGVKYRDKFNPMPLPAVALVLTLIRPFGCPSERQLTLILDAVLHW